jgi:hypothetical protein
MSCGGSMMRTSFQPLAHLVDAAAEQWLAAELLSEQDQLLVSNEITQAFRIGDKPELTFHGGRYLLTISHSGKNLQVDVHKIAGNN